MVSKDISKTISAHFVLNKETKWNEMKKANVRMGTQHGLNGSESLVLLVCIDFMPWIKSSKYHAFSAWIVESLMELPMHLSSCEPHCYEQFESHWGHSESETRDTLSLPKSLEEGIFESASFVVQMYADKQTLIPVVVLWVIASRETQALR